MGAWRMQIEQIPLGPVCLFHSLHLSLLSSHPFTPPPLLLPPLSSFLHVCSTVRQPVLSLCSRIYFTLCPLVSPPLPLSLSLSPSPSQKTVLGLCVSANCSHAVVSLCVFPCMLADSPSSLI